MSGDRLVPVETIIYGSFVKMNRLQKLTIDTFSNTPIAGATKLNIFIDLYSVIKSIFSEHYTTDIKDYTAITSGIVNMCSHYRSFFRRLSVQTKFFIISSFNICDINRKFVANYNETFFRKSQIPMFQKVVSDNLDLLEILCPYLPDIFFIRSARNYESTVIIAHLIGNILRDGNPNLIISKDLYPLQLCYEYPFTSYLYPIKRKNGLDESVMIPISDKQSFEFEFWKLVSQIRKFDIERVIDISPINFPLFCALYRFPERDLNTELNVYTSSSIIYRIVGAEKIRITLNMLHEDVEIMQKTPWSLLESRFKVLDVNFMLPYYVNDPESKCIKLQNLHDNTTVNMINSKFFSHNPLDLGKL